MQQFEHCTLLHVYREKNAVADGMANGATTLIWESKVTTLSILGLFFFPLRESCLDLRCIIFMESLQETYCCFLFLSWSIGRYSVYVQIADHDQGC